MVANPPFHLARHGGDVARDRSRYLAEQIRPVEPLLDPLPVQKRQLPVWLRHGLPSFLLRLAGVAIGNHGGRKAVRAIVPHAQARRLSRTALDVRGTSRPSATVAASLVGCS